MRLPILSHGMRGYRMANTDPGSQPSSESPLGISPQISCRIDDIYGSRSSRHCTGPSWARACVNVPEFKTGSCVSEGSDCEDCFGRCKDQFTSAGGWSIRSTGSIKCPN
jgi:hypothetical protein